jgi:glutamyl-tRNA synthetase
MSNTGMVDEELLLFIKKVALKNAIEHEGKAKVDRVVAKVIASRGDIKPKIKEYIPTIAKIVDEVNSLNINEQKSMLEDIAPEMLEKTKVEQKEYRLPPLPNATHGNVVTRFPPEPNGYPHIGHAKAVIIDEEYARMYDGKFILRFDDTNPAKERLEYYDAIMEGLEWLNVKPDIIKNTSDDIEILYRYAKMLIEVMGAYVCTCKPEVIKRNRALGRECECRSLSKDAHLERWAKMFNEYRQNEAILRFMGDMSSSNTVMRDPTLFRIIEHEHPLKGYKYRVWPTYDFASCIEDSIDGVTHAMRSKEYELRNELYYAILDRLGLRKPLVLEFSRLEFEGMPVSKRKIRPLIDKGLVHGWDDPRLPTLKALRRRGITPQAIREFVLSLGFTRADTKPPFEALEAINRKIIDPIAIRLNAVMQDDCMLLKVNGLGENKVSIRNHPTNTALGVREVNISNEFYIPKSDVLNAIGKELRLIDLCNVRIEYIVDDDGREDNRYAIASFSGFELKSNIPKVQWVSRIDARSVKILVPKQLYIDDKFNPDSLAEVNAYIESYVDNLTVGTMVQLIRLGFYRLDSKGVFIMAHK